MSILPLLKNAQWSDASAKRVAEVCFFLFGVFVWHSHGSQVLASSDVVTRKRAMYEVCLGAMNGWTLSPALQLDEQGLCDALWVLDFETSVPPKDVLRRAYVDLVKDVHRRRMVQQTLLEQQMEVKTLEEAGVVASGKAFFGQLNERNRRLTAVQPTFFLLHEASEGYARLVSEIVMSVRFTRERFHSIAGYFSLDLSRCADLFMTLMERKMGRRRDFLEIAAGYSKEVLLDILHIRLKRAFAAGGRSKVIKLAAVLVGEGLVDLGALYPLLLPSDAEAKKVAEQQRAALAAADPRKVDAAALPAGEEPKRPPLQECQAALAHNQKFALCEALLAGNHWQMAYFLLVKLQAQGLDLHMGCLERLCAQVEVIIEPLYRTPEVCGPVVAVAGAGAAGGLLHAFADIPLVLFPALKLLGPAVGLSALLHAKLCRLMIGWLVHDCETAAAHVEAILAEILLPGLALIRSNPAASSLTYSVLERLPFDARARVYSQWRREASKHPLAAWAREEAQAALKFVMRRLNSDKAAIAAYGREVGCIAHSHPLLTFDILVVQIQQYSNMIEPVVEFLSYMSLLSRDVAVFVLVENLASKKRAGKKSDGTNVAEWLSALASFIGQLFKKYKDIDVRPVLELVRNKLLDGSALELVVLENLILRMSGIEAGQMGMSEKQVAAQAGSTALKAAMRPIAVEPNMNNSSARLRKAMDGAGVIAQLMVLIVQCGLKTAVYGAASEEASLKMIGDAYDKAHGCWIQYLSFLEQTITDGAVLSQKLPSLADLIGKYKLSLPQALTCLRSVLVHRYSDAKQIAFGVDDMDTGEDGAAEEEEGKSIVAELPPITTPSHVFVAFWTLKLSDLVFPKESYDEAAKILTKRMSDLESSTSQQFEEWDSSKKAKEVVKIKAQLARLEEDAAVQMAHVESVRKHFKDQASVWFKGRNDKCGSSNEFTALPFSDVDEEARNDIAVMFLQNCLYPRCMISAEDAIFSAEFVFLLQESNVSVLGVFLCGFR